MQHLRHRILLGLFCAFSTIVVAAPINIPTIQTTNTHDHTHSNITTAVVANNQQIKQQTNLSATHFLEQQGLVQVRNQSSEQDQSVISMHGFGNNAASNTLLMIDGIPLTSFTNIAPNINVILLDNIQRITITPGSYGSLYGDQAVGGVINITTGIQQKPQNNLSIGGGNRAQALGEAYFSRRTSSHVNYSIGASGYHINHQQQYNRQNNYNVNALMDYNGEHDQVKFDFLGYQTQVQIPNPIIIQGPNQPQIDNNHSLIKTAFFALKNHWYISDRTQWITSLSTQDTDGHGFMNFPFTTHQENWLWQNEWRYRQWLITGFDLQTEDYHLTNTFQNNQVTANSGDVFSQITAPLGRAWHFIVGGRYAHQSMHAWPAPSLSMRSHSNVFVNNESLVWQAAQDWQLYVRRDTNYRFAKANEKIWVNSNMNNLKTQTGVSYETGVKWQYQQQKITLGLYDLDLNNEIAYDPQQTADAPFGKMYNLPPTQRLGVDLAGAFTINQHVSLGTQTSYVDPTFRSGLYKGHQVPSVSPWSSSVNMTYRGIRQWFINVTETYDSGFYATHDLMNQAQKLPGYFLTNVHAHKQWRVVGLGLEIDNLFNKRYARFANYYPSLGQEEYYPADGITALLKLDVKL